MVRVRGSRVDSLTTLTKSKSIKKKETSNLKPTTAGACLKVNNQGCVYILCPTF
jgi:gamma-tubulin complex component 5